MKTATIFIILFLSMPMTAFILILKLLPLHKFYNNLQLIFLFKTFRPTIAFVTELILFDILLKNASNVFRNETFKIIIIRFVQ